MAKLHEFTGEEDWLQYCERLEFYFEAKEIDDAQKQKATLLSACGASTYKLMCDLVSPLKPKDKTFAELKEIVQKHLKPKPSEIVQRYKFHTRCQQSGESLATFVAELRHLSQDCNFGDSLLDMLRDRLVCGVGSLRVQKRLLAEPDLTFESAFKISTAMETAEKNAVDLQASKAGTAGEDNSGFKMAADVNKVSEAGPASAKKPFECWFCSKPGHRESECIFKKKLEGKLRKKNKNKSGKEGKQPIQKLDSASDEETFAVFKMQSKEKGYTVKVKIDNEIVDMVIDTGASVSLINETLYKRLNRTARPSKRLRTYTGEEIPVLGGCDVSVTYNNKNVDLPVMVVRGSAPCLLGRDWLEELKLDWVDIFSTRSVEQNRPKEPVFLDEFEELFSETRGTIKDVKAKIIVDQEVKPRYFKPRPVPYALKEKVGQELDKMEAEGTIEKVQCSDWAAPIVTVAKPDKSVRICGDYKVTVNAVSKLDNYPIPNTDDLLAEIGGGKWFTKLDLTQAYTQLELEESSKDYTTINTHQGLYRFNRLPYGISSAPGIFQRCMENILRGIPYVQVRIDDILVAGRSKEEHLDCLRKVLQRLKDAGARLKRKKCEFLTSEVVYLGFKIDSTGVHPVPDKLRAIEEMPRPSDVKQLQAYLGMLQYYARFLPHLSSILAPLHTLLKKGVSWEWKQDQEQAWRESKRLLRSPKLLIHFDSEKELLLTCDASSYGLGAVLSHRMADGTDQPIAYVSRTMNSAEKNYSQIEKEALAIVFGTKKFHQYLYGKKFEIQTDHKPLLGLFMENKQIPTMSPARIQRWALTLAAYEYTIVFKQGDKNGNADGLSRLPCSVSVDDQEPEPEETILFMEDIESTPITAKQIKKWTQCDPILSQVVGFVQTGWPEKNSSEELTPYFLRKFELSVLDGCLLWGGRVIIPKEGRQRTLQDLHESHPGVCRMKSLARSYFWWPKLDTDIEALVQGCRACQTNRNRPSSAPLHPWEWPGKPWVRLHVDYAGPFLGKMFLVIVDAHSKWIEAFPMNHSTSTATIEKLRQIFAVHGLPEILVSDNGTCFTSDMFETFLKRNGVKHLCSAPYHPSTNGLAERAVQVLKRGLKKMVGGTIETRVSRLLAAYRVTPHSTTGLSPAELMFNRKIRTRFDLAKPCVGQHVRARQEQQKQHHDRARSDRSNFEVGDSVNVKNFGQGPKWLAAVVARKTGPLSYEVELLETGQVQRRHLDQMIGRAVQKIPVCVEPDPTFGWHPADTHPTTDSTVTESETIPDTQETQEPSSSADSESQRTEDKGNSSLEMPPRQSTRVRRRPGYLKDYAE